MLRKEINIQPVSNYKWFHDALEEQPKKKNKTKHEKKKKKKKTVIRFLII